MYGVQIQVTFRDFFKPPTKEWLFVQTTKGKDYTFKTESEAADFIRRWYTHATEGTVRVAKYE